VIAGENYRLKDKRQAAATLRWGGPFKLSISTKPRLLRSAVDNDTSYGGDRPRSRGSRQALPGGTQAAKAVGQRSISHWLRALNFTTWSRTICSFRLPICAAWGREAPSCRRKRQNLPRPNGVLSLLRRGSCRSRIKINPALYNVWGYPRPSHDFSIRPSDAEGLGDPVQRIAGWPDQHLCGLVFFRPRADSRGRQPPLDSIYVAEKGGRGSELSVAVIRGYRNS
jgi:hypothetical protein